MRRQTAHGRSGTRNQKLSLSPHLSLFLIVKNTFKAHLAVLFTNLFFAANYSLVKLISPAVIGPFGLNVIRVGVSMVLFWAIWSFGSRPASIQKRHVVRFILCALTGVAINQMFFVKGLTMTSGIHASLLMLTTPLLITVFALLALNESITRLKGLGLFLGIGGSVMLVATKETSSQAPNYLLGDLFIFINAISYAVYFILAKRLMRRYTPMDVVRWIFTIGFFMILPFGWSETTHTNFYSFDLVHLIALAFIIIAGTFLAYYFNAYGLQHLGAGVTGSYIYTQPVFATIIASFFLDETLTWQKLLAACFIFSGVYLVSFKKPVQKEASSFAS
ncbi:MAG TPA: DMT family transporter [Chitinophagaceae bacterium]|nr:DMT family transporter [Chitinophagaceae bacterium]